MEMMAVQTNAQVFLPGELIKWEHSEEPRLDSIKHLTLHFLLSSSGLYSHAKGSAILKGSKGSNNFWCKAFNTFNLINQIIIYVWQ